MPVADYPVHERTKITGDFRYGCHNRPAFKKFYFAPNRAYFADGKFRDGLVKITHNMSKDCQYDLSHKDPACKGCKHKMKVKN